MSNEIGCLPCVISMNKFKTEVEYLKEFMCWVGDLQCMNVYYPHMHIQLPRDKKP